jgi:predicted nucleic acid-binding protein
VDAVSTPSVPVLVDSSVWTRIATRPEVTAAISARLASGQKLCTCPLVDLELLYSARGPAEYDQWATTRAQAYPSLPLTPAAGERALHVQRQLAHSGYTGPRNCPTSSSPLSQRRRVAPCCITTPTTTTSPLSPASRPNGSSLAAASTSHEHEHAHARQGNPEGPLIREITHSGHDAAGTPGMSDRSRPLRYQRVRTEALDPIADAATFRQA